MIYASIDLETTGLKNPVNLKNGEEEDCIVEISVLLFDKKFKTIDSFETLVRPLKNVSEDCEGLEVNKITLKELKTAPSPMEVRTALFDFVAMHGTKLLPVGWNYDNFDKWFLVPFLGRGVYDNLFHYHSIDVKTLFVTMKEFMGLYKDCPGNSLPEVCKYFDVPCIGHEAKSDAYSTIRVLKKLTS